MLFFLILNSVKTTVEGSAWRRLRCEFCETEYVHRLKIRLTHNELGANRSEWLRGQSEKRALEHLERSLKNRIDPVPCPHCLQFQTCMFRRLRSDRYGWMHSAGIAVLVGAPLAYSIVNMILETPQEKGPFVLAFAAGIVFAVLGTFILLLMRLLGARYDPNEAISIEKREELARERAISVDEFRKKYPDEVVRDIGTEP